MILMSNNDQDRIRSGHNIMCALCTYVHLNDAHLKNIEDGLSVTACTICPFVSFHGQQGMATYPLSYFSTPLIEGIKVCIACECVSLIIRNKISV